MAKLILFIAIISSFFIRVFFIIIGKHVADIWHISKMGEILLMGQNPYLVLDFNVYPPLSLVISAVSVAFVNIAKIPFHFSIKILPNLADFATAFIIYQYLSKQKIKPLYVILWTSFFILNPISIIISAAHGQLDSITSFFVVLAIYLLDNHPRLSAFSLGLSIAVKPNSLILAPFFLSQKTFSKKLFRYLLFILLPVTVGILPFLNHNPVQVIKILLGYSGIADFGYAALLKGIWFQNNANPNLPSTLLDGLFNNSKLALIIGIITLALIFKDWKNLPKSILATYLLFISIYFGIGAQYLSWIIPFAIMTRDRSIIIYSLSGTVALIGFYLYFGPDLLLGKFTGTMLPFENKYFPFYFYGNLIFWTWSILWLKRIVADYLRKEFYKFSNIRKQLIIAGIALFVISLLPLVASLYREMLIN